MTTKTHRYLGGTTNCQIIHDEDRKYPGILLQGDTVSTILQGLREIQSNLSNDSRSEAHNATEELILRFETLLAIYADVLKQHGITELPY